MSKLSGVRAAILVLVTTTALAVGPYASVAASAAPANSNTERTTTANMQPTSWPCYWGWKLVFVCPR